MTTECDLLRAIARDPDDAPRLVYADWLDDDGRHDRAEFIRGQVRLAANRRVFPSPDRDTLEAILYGVTPTWVDPGDSPERRQIAHRCRTLLDTHETAWLPDLPGVAKVERVWSRGFVEAVDCVPATLPTVAEALFDLHPIHHLMLNGLGGKVDVLAALPADNSLRVLDVFASDLDRLALRQFANLTTLDRLEELSLMFNRIDDSCVDLLRDHPFFQRLRLIRLACNPLSYEGREPLRSHFGHRVRFDRVRHLNRLFAFRSNEEQRIWAGHGRDLSQVLALDINQRTTLALFDHAGELLACESRYDEGKSRAAWLQEVGFTPATIQVKRLGEVFDFPTGYTGLCDSPHLAAEEYADARDFIKRWLTAGRYRVGACCGGWWFDGQTGERVEDA